MRINRYSWLIALLFVNGALFCVQGRRLPDWPYERLFKEADTVVIAQPLESVNTMDRHSSGRIQFLGVETTFEVLHTIKGEILQPKITVLHYRVEESGENGPSLVRFRTEKLEYTECIPGECQVKGFVSGPATYMLFLKSGTDERFEPVTGQFDPKFSVRELTYPRGYF